MHNYRGTRKFLPPIHTCCSLPCFPISWPQALWRCVALFPCLLVCEFLLDFQISLLLGLPTAYHLWTTHVGCNPLAMAVGTATVAWCAILPGCSNLRRSLQAWATCIWPSFIKQPPLPQKSSQLWGGGSTSCPCSGRLGSSSNCSLYLSSASPSVGCGFPQYSFSWKHSATLSFHSLFYWFIYNTNVKCQSASLLMNIQG